MNHTIKRILYIITMSLAVITLVLSLVGVIGAWVLRSELHQTLHVVSSLSVTGLQRVRNGVAKIDPPMAQALMVVQYTEKKVRSSGQTLKDTNLIVTAAEMLLNQDFSTGINTLTTTLQSATEILQAADDTLSALNRLPFIGNQDGALSQMRQLIADLQAIKQTVRDTWQALQTKKAETLQNLVDTLTAPLMRLNTMLTAVQVQSRNVQEQLGLAEVRVPALVDQANTTITIVVIVVTLVLLWAIISQVIVFKYSLERYRRLAIKPATDATIDATQP